MLFRPVETDKRFFQNQAKDSGEDDFPQ